MERLYLLDAYALIYRAYYGLIASPRINSKGQNTSAAFGFVNTLMDILQNEKPDYIGIAFDPSGPTFRHEAYPPYKAQREATPEDIKWAVPVIKDIIRAFNIPILEVPGYEADDVIGTLAKQGAAAGVDVQMVTPDKDYAQLVAPNITMCRPGHGAKGFERLGPDEVCAKYGLPDASQVVDLLGLMGDSADNFPGCPGVGEKTAVKLIQQFGSTENMLAHTDEIKGALRQKVEDNIEDIKISRMLAEIRTDVPITLNLDELRREEPNLEQLGKIFADLEFRTFASKMGIKAPEAQNIPSVSNSYPTYSPEEENQRNLATLNSTPHEYHLIETEEDASELCRKLLTFRSVSIDTETTSTDPLTAELVGMSFAVLSKNVKKAQREENEVETCEAWYVSVSRETTGEDSEDNDSAFGDLFAAAAPETSSSRMSRLQKLVDILKPVFENPEIEKVGQNLKYDIEVLAGCGVTVQGPLFDTMLAHYVVQPELPHNMDALAESYLNYRTIHIDEILGPKGKGQLTMDQLDPKQICDYACEDADVTMRLRRPLEEAMRESGVEKVFHDIEMPLLPVLVRMELRGVTLDTKTLAETGRAFSDRIIKLEQEIYELAGHEFLLTSPRQVGEVLFEELQLSEKAKKTKSGQYSTSEEVLESLKGKHEIVGKILAHRGLKKLVSTYIEALPKLISPKDGRVHTTFNQAVTATGRLSSSNPNLQNIPVRGEDGKEIRKCFVPEKGEVFFSADYSQIELRIMAHLSGDTHMIQDFNEGRDIHAATAARVFKTDVDSVSKDQRRKAKTANFGIIYGISAFGLAERMEVSRGEAKELITSYFETYPGIREFIDKAVEKARQQGFITTEFGRRRYLPDIYSKNGTVRGFAERNAVNAPIQGTAADIIKLAMVNIDRRIQNEGLNAKMILQVHDELNFSVSPEELPRLKQLVLEEMEGAFHMSVPLFADSGEGENWLEAH